VTDEQILEAYRAVARTEGVFCEPASAAGIAGLRAAIREGGIDPVSTCVCVLTGHGLKDPDTALGGGVAIEKIEADTDALARTLGFR